MRTTSRLRQSGAVTVVEVDGRVSLYSPTTGEVLHLNDSASAVWGTLADPVTLDELVRGVAEAYGVDATEIAASVEATVEQLRSHDAVQTQAGSVESSSSGPLP